MQNHGLDLVVDMGPPTFFMGKASDRVEVSTIHVDDVQLASPPSVQDAPVPLLEHVDMASTGYA